MTSSGSPPFQAWPRPTRFGWSRMPRPPPHELADAARARLPPPGTAVLHDKPRAENVRVVCTES